MTVRHASHDGVTTSGLCMLSPITCGCGLEHTSKLPAREVARRRRLLIAAPTYKDGERAMRGLGPLRRRT